MYRFAFRGRWLLGLLLVLLTAAVCVRLGVWQLDRREQRLAFNEQVTTRGELPVAPLAEVVGGDDVPPGGPTGAGLTASTADSAAVEEADHRRVEVRGRYDADRELLVLARSLNGTPGMHVVTPLVVGDREAVLVNRGFVPLTEPDAAVPPGAKPPRDTVEVVGTFRVSEEDGRFLPADDAATSEGTVGHVTRIDVDRLERELPYELAPGSVRIEAEEPELDALPVPLPPAELGEGPHLGYAIQWFGFAAVFLGGWPLLVRRSARRDGGGDGTVPGGPGTDVPGGEGEPIRVPVAGWG